VKNYLVYIGSFEKMVIGTGNEIEIRPGHLEAAN
jgi:hypothetical protein